MMPCALTDDELRAAVAAHKAAARAAGSTMFTRRMVIHVADMAEMKPMSLVWRLEKMGLLKQGSWLWFKRNGGITKEHEAECRADRAAAATPSCIAEKSAVKSCPTDAPNTAENKAS